MNEIGGYLELELASGKCYHTKAIKLNTGRNALEYILRAYKPDKIYIPKFTCKAVFEPVNKLKVPFSFYNIDENLDPIFDLDKLEKNELIIYNNYFGLKESQCRKLSEMSNHLIIDNAQAFYSKPLNNTPTFNSARKFFGVPDGAYLYSPKTLDEILPKDISIHRMSHLHKRLQFNANKGYSDYLKVEEELCDQPVKLMSSITSKLLDSIDYESIKNKRRDNYDYLHSYLADINILELPLALNEVPMVYPLLLQKKVDRSKLAENKIYLAKYWPDIEQWMQNDEFELLLTNNLLPLPIDQRYGLNDLDKMMNTLKLLIK